MNITYLITNKSYSFLVKFLFLTLVFFCKTLNISIHIKLWLLQFICLKSSKSTHQTEWFFGNKVGGKIYICKKGCFKCIYPYRLWAYQGFRKSISFTYLFKDHLIVIKIRGNKFFGIKAGKNLNLGDCVRWQGISMNAPRGAFVGHFCLIWHCGH